MPETLPLRLESDFPPPRSSLSSSSNIPTLSTHLRPLILIHPHRVNKPIRILKRARIRADILLARSRKLGADRIARPVLGRPAPAKVGVEDDALITKVGRQVAGMRRGEAGDRLAELGCAECGC